MDQLRHEAQRDTHWVGKGLTRHWILIVALLALAAIGAALFAA